ncbi:MAG: hypothetical protein ACYDB7_15425 [Mycobacteriales bacterium]
MSVSLPRAPRLLSPADRTLENWVVFGYVGAFSLALLGSGVLALRRWSEAHLTHPLPPLDGTTLLAIVLAALAVTLARAGPQSQPVTLSRDQVRVLLAWPVPRSTLLADRFRRALSVRIGIALLAGATATAGVWAGLRRDGVAAAFVGTGLALAVLLQWAVAVGLQGLRPHQIRRKDLLSKTLLTAAAAAAAVATLAHPDIWHSWLAWLRSHPVVGLGPVVGGEAVVATGALVAAPRVLCRLDVDALTGAAALVAARRTALALGFTSDAYLVSRRHRRAVAARRWPRLKLLLHRVTGGLFAKAALQALAGPGLPVVAGSAVAVLALDLCLYLPLWGRPGSVPLPVAIAVSLGCAWVSRLMADPLRLDLVATEAVHPLAVSAPRLVATDLLACAVLAAVGAALGTAAATLAVGTTGLAALVATGVGLALLLPLSGTLLAVADHPPVSLSMGNQTRWRFQGLVVIPLFVTVFVLGLRAGSEPAQLLLAAAILAGIAAGWTVAVGSWAIRQR